MRIGGTLILASVLGASSAVAGPAEDAALALFHGSMEPAEAVEAWEQAKLDPDEAAELLRGLPRATPPAGDHTAQLVDGYGRETDAEVRLPADGPDEDGRFRAVIILHGIGGNSEQGLEIAASLVPPHTIVVAPSAQALDEDDSPEDLRTASMAKIPVLEKLKHWWSYRERSFPVAALDYLKRHYPLDTNRVLLVGYSMGGFGTWNVGLRYHHLFAGLAPMAGGISREEFVLGEDEWYRYLLGNGRQIPIFFLHGDEDEVVPVRFDQWSERKLDRLKAPFVYHEVEGGKHVLKDQLSPDSELIQELVAWLGERVRDPHPTRVRHRALGAYHGGSYWLHIDAMKGVQASVEAEAGRKNRLKIKTKGVERLTLFLDPEVFKVGRSAKLTMELDGAVQRLKVGRSLRAVAESFARTRDPELIYQHMVTLEVEPRDVEQGEGGLRDLYDRWKGGKD
jgi:predicted esterase